MNLKQFPKLLHAVVRYARRDITKLLVKNGCNLYNLDVDGLYATEVLLEKTPSVRDGQEFGS